MTKLDHALACANRRWPVFPLHEPSPGPDGKLICSCRRSCGSPAKHPRTTHGLNDATTREEQLRSWWRLRPNANIGVVTGARSGLFVLDVDIGDDGDDSLRALETKHGELPHTVRSITGSGGEHIFFCYPATHDCSFGNSARLLGPGLDTRGDGGYVVAPGSRHICGRTYEWSVDHHPDDVPLAHPPAWLLDLLRQPNRRATPPDEWRQLVANGVREGERNQAVARVAGLLLRKDIDAQVTLDLLMCWNHVKCDPPLSDVEVVGIVNSIAARELARRKGAT